MHPEGCFQAMVKLYIHKLRGFGASCFTSLFLVLKLVKGDIISSLFHAEVS